MSTMKYFKDKDFRSEHTILMGPALVDRAIRQATQHCWMMLPPDRRSIKEVAGEMQRLLDRALHDLEEDLR